MSEDIDELAELMAEPPGGSLHGRSRGPSGRWQYLDDQMSSVLDSRLPQYDNPKWNKGKRSKKPPDTIAHGNISAYANDRCRCDRCKIAWATYWRVYRAKEDTS